MPFNLADSTATHAYQGAHEQRSCGLLGSIVGSCWDQPSALAGIDRRLLLGSIVSSCWDRPSELRSARTLNLTQQTEEEEDE
jgi:hypothetical protein